MVRRVAVTGIGCVTSLGSNPEQLWDRLLRGQSGIGRTTLFDAESFPTKIAAEVRDWSLDQVGEDSQRWQLQSRQTQFAVGAAKMAMRDCGLGDCRLDPLRLGVYLGCGDAYPDFNTFIEMVAASLDGSQLDMARFLRAALEGALPATEIELQPNMASSYIASMFNAQGPHVSCFTACAASSQAIGEAADFIRRGTAEFMLAGGTHSLIHPFGLSGLSLLTALSTRNEDPTTASRPFDRERDGFVLGEGAGVLMLEEFEHARRRGAHIYGEIKGYGCSNDAYRITDTHPDGRGAAKCIERALDDAQLNPDEIDYINAHGTSTWINDKVETMAIKQVFGPQAYRTPVSSTKSMTGHLLAAAGVTELVVCLMALRDNALPPTINYRTPDTECDLDYVPNAAREAVCRNVLSNSFGFGGQNVSLVVSSV